MKKLRVNVRKRRYVDVDATNSKFIQNGSAYYEYSNSKLVYKGQHARLSHARQWYICDSTGPQDFKDSDLYMGITFNDDAWHKMYPGYTLYVQASNVVIQED